MKHPIFDSFLIGILFVFFTCIGFLLIGFNHYFLAILPLLLAMCCVLAMDNLVSEDNRK